MLYLFIIIAIVFTEAQIKNYIDKNKQLGEEEEILNGKILIRKHYNRGMFLNYLEDKKEMVKTISGATLGLFLLLFAFLLPRKGYKLLKLGFAFSIGGAISNVADRIKRGYVVDYFSFNVKKLKNVVFNIADMAIFLGSLLIALSSFFPLKFKGCTDKTAE